VRDAFPSEVQAKVIVSFAASSQKGFTGTQVVTLLEMLPFWVALDMLKEISPKILSLTVRGAAKIIDSTLFPDDKFKALDILCPVIIEEDFAVHKNDLISHFGFFDADEVTAVLDKCVPRSCIFGPVPEERVLFLIDVSGSMDDKFVHDKKTFTRLEYVRSDLDKVIRKQLKATQKMNVITFGTRVTQWQAGIVPVNTVNVDSAVAFLANMKAGGSTNTIGGFEAAFKDDQVVAIYFLSDGMPDSSTAAVITRVSELLAKKKTVIHTIGINSPPDALKMMSKLAEMTGGTFRAISEDAKFLEIADYV